MKKTISMVVLCILVLLGSAPIGTVIAAPPETNISYTDDIGCTACFNENDWDDFIVAENPFAYDGGTVADEYIINKDSIPDDFIAKITEYYVDEVNCALWYKIESAPGHMLPTDLGNRLWVFQNWTDLEGDPDSLIITQGANITVKANGEAVEEITVTKSEKVTLFAYTDSGVYTEYAWQLYIPAEDKWVYVHEEVSSNLTVSYGMVARQTDAEGLAYVRPVATVGGVKVIGEAIAVNIAETATVAEAAAFANLMSSDSAAMPLAVEDGTGSTTIYNVIIEYKFANGEQAANPWTATIEAGGNFANTITSPTVVGYIPDKAELLIEIEDISQDITYTVTYQPAEVSFTVVHQFQNADDEGYSEFMRVTHQGYTDSAVGDALALPAETMEEEGVYDLPYDIEQKIAADGTTEVVIQYDRYYYLMTFNLSGGYNVEPVYARAGASINVGIPIRAGYVFQGWNPEIPDKMPNTDMTITALWEPNPNGVNYFIAYWAENANDDGYSILRVDEHNGTPGDTVSGGDTYENLSGFHFDHADQDVTIKGDGSTVVNVYYKRNTYTLYFAYDGGDLVCDVHVHSAACYDLSCGQDEHTHTDECCKNGGTSWNHWFHSNVCCSLGLSAHTHSTSCYSGSPKCGLTGVTNHTHSVNNGCYGMKFEGIKYGQDTSNWWNQAPSGFRWTNSESGEGYTYAPDMPNNDLIVIGETLTNSYLYTIHYYEEGTTTKVKEDNTYYRNSNNYYLTSTDYIAIPGYTCLASGRTNPDDNLVYRIYYRRNNYTLTFKNGGEVKDVGSVPYGSDISGQYYVPTYNGDDPEGFTFGGWYTTEQCVDGTEWNHENATMPYNNLMLYAKWAPVKREVKLYITKADMEAGNQYLDTIILDHNSTVTEPAIPDNGDYSFVGWFYEEDGVEKAYDFEIPVRKNLNLYGKWVADELATYTIKYAFENADGSLTYIADDTQGSAIAGYDKTFEAKVGNDLYEGYRSGYYPTTNSHSMNILLGEENTYTFLYVEKESVNYTVRYLEKDTGKVLYEEKSDNTKEVVHTENFVYISGYRPDAYQKRLVLSADESENVITFWYVSDTTHAPVLVKHYLQYADGSGYNTENPYLTTTDLDALIDAEYSVDIITTIEGFEFKNATAKYEDGDTETSVSITIGDKQVSVQVTDKGLLIELYYDRISYPYEFRFLQQGTDTVLRDPITGTARYGSQVTETAIDIPGFICTSLNHSMTIQSESGSSAVKNVRIFYYVEEVAEIQYVPVGGGTTNPSVQTNIPVFSGVVGGSVATPNDGYIFKGWYMDEACTVPVNTEWVSDTKIVPQKSKYYDDEKQTLGWHSVIYYAKFEPGAADLTIERKNAEEGQVYVYEVKNTETAEMIYVTIVGDGQTTIHDLPLGEYTVTQQNGWSWRYSDSVKNITHQDIDGVTVTFDGDSVIEQWLNGNSELVENQRK